jgi:3-oxoacyl-[acyl-carrier protein] reductase
MDMDLELEGRRALVTGSSSGIGAAIAARLVAEGCEVVVHGRRREPAEALAARLRESGGHATAVAADLLDAASMTAMLDEVARSPVDILVANAGPWEERRFDEADDADWLTAFEANVLSVVRCARRLAPTMRERGWGRIVTVTTRGVLSPLPNMVDLSATKAAVANLSTGLAEHLAGSGVTVNTVSPGVVLTPSVREMFEARARAAGDTRSFDELEAEVAASYARNPTGRLGRPEDIADAVAFLVSERASYVNGATLRVDGGLTGTINP